MEKLWETDSAVATFPSRNADFCDFEHVEVGEGGMARWRWDRGAMARWRWEGRHGKVEVGMEGFNTTNPTNSTMLQDHRNKVL